MMMNLFSIFDPSNYFFIELNWLMMGNIIMLFPLKYWKLSSRYIMLFNLFFIWIYNELKIVLMKNFYNLIIFMTLIIMILITNFLGLFPYIFTSSSHLVYSLAFSLPLWVLIMLYGWINITELMFAHMLPLGTPVVLMNFMILIETVSNIIRPFTLAIRLTANMIAGHLLLTLLGMSGVNINKVLLLILLMVQIMLFILEMSVSLIQSYVFTVLSTLYMKEVM